MERVVWILQHNAHIILYGIVGLLTVGVDYGIFLFTFKLLYFPIFIANALGLVCGFIVSFTGNRVFVFKANKQNTHHSLLKQILLYGVLLSINTILSYGIIQLLITAGISPVIGKGVAIVAIAIWNFVIYKKIIFKKREDLAL